MNRRSMLAASAAVLSSAGSISAVGVVAGAQQPSEIDKVREASTALYASLSSLDVRPMERFWAHEFYVRYIGPQVKPSPSVGMRSKRPLRRVMPLCRREEWF